VLIILDVIFGDLMWWIRASSRKSKFVIRKIFPGNPRIILCDAIGHHTGEGRLLPNWVVDETTEVSLSMRLIADIEGILYQLEPLKDVSDFPKNRGLINFASLSLIGNSSYT
jgi:hypothetical protein